MSDDALTVRSLGEARATMAAPHRPHPIVGVWRLLAHQTIFEDGEVVNHFGSHPRGRLILTAAGFMMGFVVDSRRKPGLSLADRADLHRSMIAYSGAYRIEGDRFTVSVDLSWHQMWDGTEQTRTFRIEEPRLHIVSATGPSFVRAGAISFGRLSWEREDQSASDQQTAAARR